MIFLSVIVSKKVYIRQMQRGYKIEKTMKDTTNKYTKVIGHFRRLWNISIANDDRQWSPWLH